MDQERLNKLENTVASLQYSFHTHRHTQSDGTYRIPLTHKFYFRLLASGTDTAVANVVGGDVLIPISGYIQQIDAFVDTAGITNTTEIDVNKNGTSVMTTKLIIDSTEKNTLTTATPCVFKEIVLNRGDILTFDVDAVSVTPAKGLTLIITIIE